MIISVAFNLQACVVDNIQRNERGTKQTSSMFSENETETLFQKRLQKVPKSQRSTIINRVNKLISV